MWLIDTPIRPQLFVLTPPEEVMPASVIPMVRHIIKLAHRLAPPLTPLDLYMTSVHFTQLTFEALRLPRGRPVETSAVVECWQLALHSVACCDEDLAREAGVIPRIVLPRDRLQERFDSLIRGWSAEVRAIAQRARREGLANLTPRERVLFEGQVAISEDRIAGTEAMLSSLRAATVAAARRNHRGVERDELDPKSLLAGFYLATEKVGNVLDLAMTDEQGRLVPGVRQVRDQLLETKQPRRQPLAAEEERIGDGLEVAAIEDLSKSGTTELEEKELVTAARSAVTRFVAGRLPRVKPGSARQLVLESFEALLSERITLTALARSSGMSVSALSEAYVAERTALRASITTR